MLLWQLLVQGDVVIQDVCKAMERECGEEAAACGTEYVAVDRGV